MNHKTLPRIALVLLAWGLLLSVAAAQPKSAGSADGKAKSSGAEETSSAISFLDNLEVGEVFRNNEWTNWAFLGGAIFAGVLLGGFVSLLLGRLGEKSKSYGWHIRSHVLTDLVGPAKLALLTVGLSVGLAKIEMSQPLSLFAGRCLLLLVSMAIAWYAFNLIGVFDIMMRRRAEKTDSTLDDQLVPLVRKTLRVFLVVVWMLFVVDSVFGGDIGAWLAGLGIAGLAVSLAAQDSLKNLFGSITILFDRPFQIGERIQYAGFDGVVKDIGFRSTKIQTLTGHTVTIPNSNIVNDPVENIGVRKSIRRIMNVTITYDTPREKIEPAVQILRGILEEDGIREPIHPVIDGNEMFPRVYFNEMLADSLNLFVIYWYAPPSYWDYMEHAQRLNLRIFEEFEKAGIEFAFPTQTLYLAGDPNRELAVQMLGDGRVR